MFVLYCPGERLPGGLEPRTPAPGSLGPAAADAPGALNALGNVNPIPAGKEELGGSRWELCPLFFPRI